ncbi:hypothetical protein [Desulfitispora alkaliphila]
MNRVSSTSAHILTVAVLNNRTNFWHQYTRHQLKLKELKLKYLAFVRMVL